MDGWVKIGTEIDTKSFDKQIVQLEDELDTLEQELKIMKSDSSFDWSEDIIKTEAKIESLTNKLSTLKTKQTKLDKLGLTNLEQSIKNVGKQTESVVKKVGKWALAVFGIRSAYMGIRRAISLVRGQNEEIDASFKATETFWSTAFEPLVKRLVSWMMTLVQYVNYLAKAWFGVDILAKSNEKTLKRANKQAKEYQKTLFGFDEKNVINDNGGTGVAGIEPLPIPDDAPIPSWLEWLSKNGTTIIAIISGIGAGIIAMNLSNLIKDLGLIKNGLTGLQLLGIGLIVAGLILLIKDVIKYLKDPSWTNFGKILISISIILLGLSAVIGSIPLAVAGAITLILGLVVSNWSKIQGIINNALVWLDGKLKFVEKRFGLLGELITEPIRIAVNNMKNIFEGLFKSIKGIFNGILLIFKGDFKNGFISIAKGIANAFITVINTMINGLNLAISPFRALIVAFGKVTGKGWTMDNIKIPTIKYMKTGGIINLPNRGVPLANNVRGGESGAEGVIPLTDSQAMATLGSEIGKNVTIYITVENKMDGKVIGREFKKVKGEQDFLMNK